MLMVEGGPDAFLFFVELETPDWGLVIFEEEFVFTLLILMALCDADEEWADDDDDDGALVSFLLVSLVFFLFFLLLSSGFLLSCLFIMLAYLDALLCDRNFLEGDLCLGE